MGRREVTALALAAVVSTALFSIAVAEFDGFNGLPRPAGFTDQATTTLGSKPAVDYNGKPASCIWYSWENYAYNPKDTGNCSTLLWASLSHADPSTLTGFQYYAPLAVFYDPSFQQYLCVIGCFQLNATEIPPPVAPVTAPVVAPVTPPVVAPVTPPAVAPVTPPAVAPVTPPVVAPVTPPVVAPVTPPVVAPVTPPVVAPVKAPSKAPLVPTPSSGATPTSPSILPPTPGAAHAPGPTPVQASAASSLRACSTILFVLVSAALLLHL